MLEAAAKALLKPFEISLFADPAGSFTTAAALLAVVEKTYREKFGAALAGARIAIFGATGVVGTAAGVIGALEGAKVTYVGHDGVARVAQARGGGEAPVRRRRRRRRRRLGRRSRRRPRRRGHRALRGASRRPGAGRGADRRRARPEDRRRRQRRAAARRRGRRRCRPTARRSARNGAVGIGALAVGNVKYRTESGLFKQMTESGKPLKLDFRQAFALARTLA